MPWPAAGRAERSAAAPSRRNSRAYGGAAVPRRRYPSRNRPALEEPAEDRARLDWITLGQPPERLGVGFGIAQELRQGLPVSTAGDQRGIAEQVIEKAVPWTEAEALARRKVDRHAGVVENVVGQLHGRELARHLVSRACPAAQLVVELIELLYYLGAGNDDEIGAEQVHEYGTMLGQDLAGLGARRSAS